MCILAGLTLGAINNYVDDILSNYDPPTPPTHLRVDKNRHLHNIYPLSHWPPMDCPCPMIPLLVHVVIE